MKITIQIEAHELTCMQVVEAINRSRLNAQDETPFTGYEDGKLYDVNGNVIGTWITEES